MFQHCFLMENTNIKQTCQETYPQDFIHCIAIFRANAITLHITNQFPIRDLISDFITIKRVVQFEQWSPQKMIIWILLPGLPPISFNLWGNLPASILFPCSATTGKMKHYEVPFRNWWNVYVMHRHVGRQETHLILANWWRSRMKNSIKS